MSRRAELRSYWVAGVLAVVLVCTPGLGAAQTPPPGASAQGSPPPVANVLTIQLPVLVAEANQPPPVEDDVVEFPTTIEPDPQAESEEVVVTGTRITNPNLSLSTPVLSVGENEIELQQAQTAEELLRQLPGAVPSIGPAVNNGADGSARIDLRGLGSNRNIILLDGMRVTPVGLDAVVDLNNVPLALVERVDVVTGGASTVYGADAISGALNFVLKDDFEGVELDAGYRITQEGDGEIFRADLTLGAGFEDGRGNVVLGIAYQDANAVFQGDRPFAVESLSSVTGEVQGSGTTVPTVFLFPLEGQVDPATGQLVDTFNTFNFNPFNVYQTPFERFNILAKAQYQITPRVEAYARGLFAQNRVSQIVAPSGSFFQFFQLPLSNPFLPVGVRDQICADPDVALSPAACAAAATVTDPTEPGYEEITVQPGRRFTELGPRFSEFESDVFQLSLGLRGDIGDNWRWDVSGQYGESDQVENRRGWGLASRLQQSLRAVSPTECVDPTGNCVPVNLFGPEGTLGADGFAQFFDVPNSNRISTTLATANVNLSGDLAPVTSPFASTPVGVAVGAEYRRYTAEQSPDLPSSIQDEVLGTGAPDPAFTGAFDVVEGYFETIIPLVENKPYLYNLSFEGGARLSSYSSTGFSTTWKAGGNWSPSEGVKLRGVYQRAVRSPNIEELFEPQITGLENLAVDPCQGALPVGNPGLTDLCIATGVPPAQIGNVPAPSAGQINATTGGNPDIDVERARTFTIGLVLNPPTISNFTASLDYFNIFVNGAITDPTVGDIINPCYDPALNPTFALVEACGLIGRNPLSGGFNGGGETLGVLQVLSNQGRINTSGLDFAVAYGADLEDWGIGSGNAGAIAWQLNAVYTIEQRFQSSAQSIDRECIGFYSVSCPGSTEVQIPQPKTQFNQRLTYTWNWLDVSLQHRYIGRLEIEPEQAGNFLPEFSKISSRNYLDFTLRGQVTDFFSITGTINNLINSGPPIVGNNIGSTAANSGNTFPTIYTALGRTFTVSGNLRF